jgi:hypothetical protein
LIYEIRVCAAVDGKAAAMRDRFKIEMVPRFDIELVGVFEAP